MKKRALLIPLMLLGVFTATGCKSEGNKSQLTYGTLVDTSATRLSYGSLSVKVNNKENMLVVVYQEGMSCGCWTIFSSVIDQYVQTYHTKIYKISAFDFPSEKDAFGLTVITDTAVPSIALFKEGKVANEFIKKDDNKAMFESMDGLRKAVTKIAKDPQYLFVDQAYLDNALFVNKEEVIVYYLRATCSDCNYAFPNIFKPYTEENTLSKKIWFIDLDVPGIRCDNEGNCSSGLQTYIDFKNNHHMSVAGDETFGFNEGVVPTIQIWRNGNLVDMGVCYNDVITAEDGKYKVSDSYYTSERASKLSYTNEVIKGREIPEEQIEFYDTNNDGENDYIAWNKDYANEVYKPIIESFLNMYVK